MDIRVLVEAQRVPLSGPSDDTDTPRGRWPARRL